MGPIGGLKALSQKNPPRINIDHEHHIFFGETHLSSNPYLAGSIKKTILQSIIKKVPPILEISRKCVSLGPAAAMGGAVFGFPSVSNHVGSCWDVVVFSYVRIRFGKMLRYHV